MSTDDSAKRLHTAWSFPASAGWHDVLVAGTPEGPMVIDDDDGWTVADEELAAILLSTEKAERSMGCWLDTGSQAAGALPQTPVLRTACLQRRAVGRAQSAAEEGPEDENEPLWFPPPSGLASSFFLPAFDSQV